MSLTHLYVKDNNGYTPLNQNLKNKNLEVVKYLISVGCDKNAKDNFSRTTLQLATIFNNLEVANYLKSIGATM